MRLARFTQDGRTTWGYVEGSDVLPVAESTPSLVEVLTRGGTPAVAALRAGAGQPVPLADVRLEAPIEQPGKVVCVGLNYRAHALESGLAVPTEPLLFMKFPSSVTGPSDPIRLPPTSHEVDWEAELAVVIGRHAEGVAEADALDHVFGYLVANDVSARDLQAHDVQWVRAKSYTSFCPLGPWITTADEVGDGSGLTIQLRVNGALKQDSNTSDLVADVAAIVSYVSAVAALEPGDIVLTGTPAGTGVGLSPQQFLAAGDVVRTSIEGLGELVNPVVAA